MSQAKIQQDTAREKEIKWEREREKKTHDHHVLSWNSNINIMVLNIQPIWVHGYMGLELYTSTLFLAIFKSQLQVLPLFSLEPWLNSNGKRSKKKQKDTNCRAKQKTPNQNMPCFWREFPRFLVAAHFLFYPIIFSTVSSGESSCPIWDTSSS